MTGDNTTRGDVTDDTIELRVPLKADYLAVLRASVGVIAGGLSMTFDEVMQLRVAPSEAFELAMRRHTNEAPAGDELTVQFVVRSGSLEMVVSGPDGYAAHLDREEGRESRALLESLVDEVDSSGEEDGGRVLRLVKHSTRAGAEEQRSG